MKNVQKDIQVFVSNLLPKGVRHDTLEGRDFIVAPVVMLTEGVHAGSAGPVLYTREELAKVPEVWDHKPVVVYHPNGSACQPEVLSSRKVGVILRTKFDRGRLKAEAWLDPSRVEMVDARVKEAVESGKVMEVSTGLFADLEPEEGEWKGEKYVAIARNIRPDHLAILPDMVGACSVADGAGLLRNVNMREEIVRRVREALRREETRVQNEISHSTLFTALSKAVQDRFGQPNNGPGPVNPAPFVVDVFEDYVVFEQGDRLWRVGYEVKDDQVTLSQEEPEEVRRSVEYKLVTHAVTKTEQDGEHPASHYLVVEDPEKPSTWHLRVKDVDGNLDHRLMGAAWAALHGGYRGNKYEGPNKQEALRKLKALYEREKMELPTENARNENMENDKKKETSEPVKNEVPEPKTEQNQTEAKVENAAVPAPKPLTAEEYIAQAPPEIREVLQNGLQTYKDQKDAAIHNLLAVKGNPFTKEELEQKSLVELRRLETLAAAAMPKPVFTGQAEVANSTKTEEPLPVPVLNFERKEK